MENTSRAASSCVPYVVRDGRFRAGRKLVTTSGIDAKSAATAVDVFATLLQQARAKFGPDHYETVPAYYEYGNALLRQHVRSAEKENEEEKTQWRQLMTTAGDPASRRNAAAAAAERRAAALAAAAAASAAAAATASLSEDRKVAPTSVSSGHPCADTNVDDTKQHDSKDHDDDIDEDLGLALEMMETAWSILDETLANAEDGRGGTATSGTTRILYRDYFVEQRPRILTGLGDVLSALHRHADAIYVYLRALSYRESARDKLVSEVDRSNSERNNDNDIDLALELRVLNCRRYVVEAIVLVAEELLKCEPSKDVITTENKLVLVTADDRIEYARGYYDKARDELQETLVVMGRIAPKLAYDPNFIKSKQDVCFVATMVMGVGTALASIDEEEELQKNQQRSTSPSKAKKLKQSK